MRVELRSGGNVDAIMDLKIHEAVTLEFIPDAAWTAESAGAEFRWDVGVSPQFDVQAMVGASETECLGSEVWGAFVEVWGRVEGWVELSEGPKFRQVGGDCHKHDPPSSVSAFIRSPEQVGIQLSLERTKSLTVSNLTMETVPLTWTRNREGSITDSLEPWLGLNQQPITIYPKWVTRTQHPLGSYNKHPNCAGF